MVGKIAIPYLRPAGVVSIRFRRLGEGDGPKYTQPKGSSTWIYNTASLAVPGHSIAIAEGEIDAMIAVQCGVPTIGIPGAQAWKPHYRSVLDGYSEIKVFIDADDQGAGEDFADKIAEDMDDHGLRRIKMPPGHDVNSFVQAEGVEAFRRHIGLDN